jgi:hypothetical protein
LGIIQPLRFRALLSRQPQIQCRIVLDGFYTEQVLAKRLQAGRIPLGGLVPGKKFLGYLAIETKWIGPETVNS